MMMDRPLTAEELKELHDAQPPRLPGGEIVAENVSTETYMADYAAHFYEWVEGYLIKMSPVNTRHFLITDYLIALFRTFFKLRRIGTYRSAPFVMKLGEKSKREPDLQIILQANQDKLKATFMDGAADICIEVLSPGTEVTDRGDKFIEYEQGGVREYWLIDPIRKDTIFYRRNEAGVYIRQELDSEDRYQTPLLPGFWLYIPTLWLEEDDMPDAEAILTAVKQMIQA